jgi:nucleotide-binding universal stress UspA family protein
MSAAPAPVAVSPAVRVVPKKILIATDFSESSERALSYALAIARVYGSELQLVHVVSIRPYLYTGVDALGAAVGAAERDMVELQERLVRGKQLEGICHRSSVLRGYPGEVLSEFIRREHADLVVMGTHGRTGLRKFLLGSVAEEVFRKSPCAVLTVGPNAAPAPEVLKLETVVFATDFSPFSNGALTHAESAAREFAARLVMLHVLEPGEESSPNRGEVEAELRARMEQLLGSQAEGLRTEFAVGMGDTAGVIVEASAKRHADLIVLGLKPPMEFADRLPWRYAYKIVCDAECPVLTVRGRVRED